MRTPSVSVEKSAVRLRMDAKLYLLNVEDMSTCLDDAAVDVDSSC
jgi:hypothetical protein